MTLSADIVLLTLVLLVLRVDSTFRYDMDLQTCMDNFDIERDKIIRTKDSTERGAVNLSVKDVSSREECLRICCETDSCDVFVYEEKQPGTYCYTFHCGPPSESKCRFSKHGNYTVGILAVDRRFSELENQMKHEQDLVSLRQVLERVTPSTTAVPNIPVFPANIPSAVTTSNPRQSQGSASGSGSVQPQNQQDVRSNPRLQQSEGQSNVQQTQNILQHVQETNPQTGQEVPASGRGGCSRYQFECRSTLECIAIYNACDGIAQCPDGSDEAPECPTIGVAGSSPAFSNSPRHQSQPQSPPAPPSAAPHSPPSQSQSQSARDWLASSQQGIAESQERHQLQRNEQMMPVSHHSSAELQQQQHEEMLHQQLVQQRLLPPPPQQQQYALADQQQSQIQQQPSQMRPELSQQSLFPRHRLVEEAKGMLGTENRGYPDSRSGDGSAALTDRRHGMSHAGSPQGEPNVPAGVQQVRAHSELESQSQQLMSDRQPQNMGQGSGLRQQQQQMSVGGSGGTGTRYFSGETQRQQVAPVPGQVPGEGVRQPAPSQGGRPPYADYYYEETGGRSSQYNKMPGQFPPQGQEQLQQKPMLSGARLQADLASVSYDNRPRMTSIEGSNQQLSQPPQIQDTRPAGLSPLNTQQSNQPVIQNQPTSIIHSQSQVQTQNRGNESPLPVQRQPSPSTQQSSPSGGTSSAQSSSATAANGGASSNTDSSKSNHPVTHNQPAASAALKERIPEINFAADALVADGETSTPRGAIISLSLGLSITGVMLALVGCRMRDVKRRLLRRSGKGSFVHDADADFLVNGMYL